MKLPPALAAAFFVAIAALPARAALFDDEEARKRIDATNQRLTQVQKQLDDRIAALELQLKSQGLLELFNQVEQLKGDAAKLRGQIEVLTFELEQAQKRQRDLYVDLDSRLRKLEGGPGANVPAAGAQGSAGAPTAAAPVVGAAPSPGAGVPAPPANSAPPLAPTPGVAGAIGGEQRSYDAALDQFKGGNYGVAIASFASFVKAHPKSPLAPSAQYWIGNAQFAQREFRAAIVSQRQLIASYPDSQKVPDAMLNIATCQSELGDTAASRRTLEDLVAKHAQSDAAAKARQRLAIR